VATKGAQRFLVWNAGPEGGHGSCSGDELPRRPQAHWTPVKLRPRCVDGGSPSSVAFLTTPAC
jgi:hypothetical protein